VRASWADLHPKVRAHEGRGSRGPLPVVVGTLVSVEVERLPSGERRREPRILWPWWRMAPRKPRRTWNSSGARTSGASTWSIPSASSNRLWDGPRLGCATPSRPTGGRGRWWPLSSGLGWRGRVLADRRLCPGNAATTPATRRRSEFTRRFDAFVGTRDASEAAETLREIARKAERSPLWPSQTLPGPQNDRLRPRRQQTRSIAMDIKLIAILLVVKTQAKSCFFFQKTPGRTPACPSCRGPIHCKPL
jgi:hypothetical protein